MKGNNHRVSEKEYSGNTGSSSHHDSAIAAAVTFVVTLLLLLILFFGGISYRREQLAEASTPEIQLDMDEEEFIEPEIVSDLGEANATVQDAPAPSAKGEPEPAPVENTKQVIPDKNPNPAPPVEKPITQKNESPVKATTPQQNDEEKQKVTSKLANKFSGPNGTQNGTSGSSGAGGTGVGISGSVSGRTFKGCPKPSVELQNKVVVEVKVTIDSNGRVTKATARSKSGKASTAILRACEQAARGARWSEDKDTPSATGSITFTITPK